MAFMIIWVVYVVLLLMLGWLLWRWNEIWYVSSLKARCSHSNTKMPPGHLGFPLLGETLSFLWFFNIKSRPDDFITSKRHKYGYNEGIYRTHLYGSPSIIACSPSICKFVLNSSDKFTQQWPTVDVLGANSAITLREGPRHTIIKSFILKSINQPDSISRILLQIQPTIVAALESWSQLPKIIAFYHVKKVTLDYTMRYIAHLEFSSSDLDDIAKQCVTTVRGFRAQPWDYPGTTYRRALKSRRAITKKLREELEKRKKKNEEGESTTRDEDLMDGLMQMKDEQGKYLSDEAVLDNVVSTILVGHIAVAYALTWSLQYLANAPHVLNELKEENMAMFKELNNKSITYADTLKLKYTNKVVEETIRMANLSAFVFRKAIDDVEFEGYLIPKGWKVIVWLRNLHTDPTNFEDPTCFNPDRWDSRPKHGTFSPFGGGARACPGSSLVRATLALFLHHLSIGYKWEVLNPGVKINYLSHPLPSDGLEISMTKV